MLGWVPLGMLPRPHCFTVLLTLGCVQHDLGPEAEQNMLPQNLHGDDSELDAIKTQQTPENRDFSLNCRK